jgi:hypothetical protein
LQAIDAGTAWDGKADRHFHDLIAGAKFQQTRIMTRASWDGILRVLTNGRQSCGLKEQLRFISMRAAANEPAGA